MRPGTLRSFNFSALVLAAMLTPQEIDAVAKYVVKSLGPKERSRGAPPADD